MESSFILNSDKEIAEKVQTFCLVGKILIETSFPTHLVQSITRSSWRYEKDYSVSYIARNIFMFAFESKNDFVRVLLDSPWSVKGSLLVLSPWASAKTRHEFHFSRSPFWVQVHGIPINYFTLKNMNEIGHEISHELGTLIRVDDKAFRKTPKCGKVLRIRVSVDVSKPLKKGFLLGRGLLPGVYVGFKYERLFRFCYNCGRIGHIRIGCTFAPNSFKFGPSLRAVSPFDHRYFGACTDMVVSPQSNSVMVKSMMKVCERMQTGSIEDCSLVITKSYLWKKFAINSIDSVVMVMNSGIIFSSASLLNSYQCKWRLLAVMICFLIHLALKMRSVVRGSSFIKGYNVRVNLADQGIAAFVETSIFAALCLMFLA